mgnify:FL=1|jgi:hypothetical protein|tara:strand:- start:9 stop:395 length:387 start_codon:yes stop_codon:yes gene_type:complete
MARWTYAFSNGMFNDFHREWEGLAAIDGDLFEVCPKCYEPLALLETCYDKGQKYKATTFTEIVASRLKIPCFLVFYRRDEQGTMWVRYKRLRSSESLKLVHGDEFIRELYQVQEDHKDCCKYATPYNI